MWKIKLRIKEKNIEIFRLKNGKIVVRCQNNVDSEKAVDQLSLNKILYDDDVKFCNIHAINIENGNGNRLHWTHLRRNRHKHYEKKNIFFSNKNI